MSHALELDWIRSLQQIRNPILDGFFKSLNFFDRPEFFLVLVPAIWLGINWKAGLRLFYILLLGNFFTRALKHFFALPRPFHLDPSVGLIHVGGYGFPSGAAQSAILLSGLLIIFWKNRWRWPIALFYTLLISFSRVYLGVHFPTDILGGWILGLFVLAIFVYVRPSLERQLEKLSIFSLFLTSQLVPLLLMVIWQSPTTIQFCSIAMGMGIGLFVSHRYQLFLSTTKNYRVLTLRIGIGILGTFACYGLTSVLPFANSATHLVIQGLLLGLWLGLGSYLCCQVRYLKR